MTTTRVRPLLYLGIGMVWLITAIVLGATGQVARLRPPVPQLVLGGLTALLILAGTLLPGFRVWIAGLNLRQIVALHLTRFVGIYFLVLYGRGELPFAFAVPGGWGDIAVATGALGLVLLVPDLAARRAWLSAWNWLGLADLLLVVATASWIAMTDFPSMAPLLRLPLSLLPTFLVPLLLATHLLLLRRLRAG
ncbi:MAG: hypothetical protein IPI38_09530 [Gemmatimonadetes bacterium]|nr:hypothetical protein [Gemmatimonadota bacterium]MBK6781606.1 hypothetical protein [Gemmatimonadota bacterium]MBK7715650.1 hypothetical protein [Gemmatimonadota bacterium]MBK7925615.1 hypothetical protein [Gemmatimonadota bacterium]MBK9691120.1 hypothetical protein [Gemmatimonadota bacterium]